MLLDIHVLEDEQVWGFHMIGYTYIYIDIYIYIYVSFFFFTISNGLIQYVNTMTCYICTAAAEAADNGSAERPQRPFG